MSLLAVMPGWEAAMSPARPVSWPEQMRGKHSDTFSTSRAVSAKLASIPIRPAWPVAGATVALASDYGSA
jgi:hypothetical protein